MRSAAANLIIVASVLFVAAPSLPAQDSTRGARVEQRVQPRVDATGEEQSELARLRELERKTTRIIEASKKAFVFLEGGSGFLISPDGLVLTNDHVVLGKKEAVAHLTGGESFRAKVLGHDPEGDVALLQLQDAKDLPFLSLGDSSRLKVGQEVLAIGDPFLLASMPFLLNTKIPPDHEPSASLGIVSALHRYSDTYADAIQVDVAVNRGNSGGPLLTLDGKVVGINGKIETRFAVGINSGVGYAVPSNQIKRFLELLKNAEGGNVAHGVIVGLRVEDRAGDHAGLPVLGVEDGTPAREAGFREGDVILTIEGAPVVTKNRYKGILHTYPVGRNVKVRVARGKETLTLQADIRLKRRPALGVKMENGPDGGVLVKEVPSGSEAEKAGLKSGDVILSVQGLLIPTLEIFNRALSRLDVGQEVFLGVVRKGKPVQLKIRLERATPTVKKPEASPS